MTYPQTANLERDLAPALIREILAVREEPVTLSLSDAIRIVGTRWFYDALDNGFSWEVAQDARRYVRRVGNQLKASYRNRSGS